MTTPSGLERTPSGRINSTRFSMNTSQFEVKNKFHSQGMICKFVRMKISLNLTVNYGKLYDLLPPYNYHASTMINHFHGNNMQHAICVSNMENNPYGYNDYSGFVEILVR